MLNETDSKVNDIKREELLKQIEESTSLPGEWKELKLECPHCMNDQFVYIYDDKKTCYCVQCDEEFDAMDILGYEGVKTEDSLEDREIQEKLNDLISDDPEIVKQLADRIVTGERKQLQLPGHTPNSSTGYGFKSYSSFINSCTHRPQHIINGDSWGVWAGKKEDCKYDAKDFDVILNLTFTSIKEPHVIPIEELREFEEYDCQYKEIQLDWPDYGVINMPRDFWVRLLQYLEKNKLRMLVFCLGGHGRTGTALAIMMCLALDYTPEQAFSWIRQNYCFSAIETQGQESYVRRIVEGKEKNENLLNDAVIEYVAKN